MGIVDLRMSQSRGEGTRGDRSRQGCGIAVTGVRIWSRQGEAKTRLLWTTTSSRSGTGNHEGKVSETCGVGHSGPRVPHLSVSASRLPPLLWPASFQLSPSTSSTPNYLCWSFLPLTPVLHDVTAAA
jgi:hypothetical protein